MHLGRDSEKGNAIVLLEIDEELGSDDLTRLRELPNITDVQYLNFPGLR